MIRWTVIAAWLRTMAYTNPRDPWAGQWIRDASFCDLMALTGAEQREMPL